MKDARICISPLDHSAEFGRALRLSAYGGGVEDFDVLLELMTDRDKIKILCSPEWAEHLAEVLQATVKECRKRAEPLG